MATIFGRLQLSLVQRELDFQLWLVIEFKDGLVGYCRIFFLRLRRPGLLFDAPCICSLAFSRSTGGLAGKTRVGGLAGRHRGILQLSLPKLKELSKAEGFENLKEKDDFF